MRIVEPKRILMVEGGPAGSTAARELCRHGTLPAVFEQDRSVGGISRADVFCGHRFISREPRVNWIWDGTLDRRFTRARRLQNSKSCGRHLAPDASRTSVGIECFVNERDDLWCSNGDLCYHEGAVTEKE